MRYVYIYIARCQVVVKFYRDLYFGYSPPHRSCGDQTDIDFLILPVNTTPETDKAVKVSATAIVK